MAGQAVAVAVAVAVGGVPQRRHQRRRIAAELERQLRHCIALVRRDLRQIIEARRDEPVRIFVCEAV